MFTGDASGDILYRNLCEYGFANQPLSLQRGDGLHLSSVYISAICRCLPPGNKPTPQEISTCLPYLVREMEYLKELQGLVALGRIAYEGIVRIFSSQGMHLPGNEFGHGNLITPSEGRFWVLQSYHPSRQNTQTGRLTENMFADIWAKSRELIFG
jgi:uracil-DNA glycosylase family 4